MQSLPKVLLVDAAPGIGGAERVVIPVIGRRFPTIVAGSDPVVGFARTLGLEVRRCVLPPLRGRGLRIPRLMWVAPRLALLARRSGASVIYANQSRAIAYSVAAASLARLPLIVHNHELLPRGGFVKTIEMRATCIVVPSAAAAEPFGGSGKVRIIPTGIDLDRFNRPADKERSKARLGIGGTVVGFVGRADPSKGMIDFVRIAETLAAVTPSVSFLLVGGATFPHEKEHFEEIRAMAEQSLGRSLVLAGETQAVADHLHAMDVIVHTAAPETLPTTLIEAAACGVPAVAYRGGGVDEIVADGRTGLTVAQGDVSGAAAAVERLISDPTTLASMSDACRARAEESFGLSRFEAELMSLVSEVAR